MKMLVEKIQGYRAAIDKGDYLETIQAEIGIHQQLVELGIELDNNPVCKFYRITGAYEIAVNSDDERFIKSLDKKYHALEKVVLDLYKE